MLRAKLNALGLSPRMSEVVELRAKGLTFAQCDHQTFGRPGYSQRLMRRVSVLLGQSPRVIVAHARLEIGLTTVVPREVTQ